MRLGHGDDGYRHAATVRLNFSSNVRSPDPTAWAALQRHLQTALAGVDRYPEAAAETLTAKLAQHHDVAAEEIWVANGAADAIDRLAHCWRGRRSWVPVPTFSEYADGARRHDHAVFTEAVAGAELDFKQTSSGDVVWWCNPNNPTGDVTERDAVLARVDARPDLIFVLDQAYSEFCDAAPVTPADAVVRPNLVLVRSLTKVHAIPGLRLGYVVAHRDIIARLEAAAVPWAVNALALAAGEFLVGRPGLDPCDRDAWCAEARRVAQALAALNGVTVRPSATPFFLFRVELAPAAALKRDLLRDHDLLIRDAGNFDGLDAHWARICVREIAAENDMLIAALDQWTRR